MAKQIRGVDPRLDIYAKERHILSEPVIVSVGPDQIHKSYIKDVDGNFCVRERHPGGGATYTRIEKGTDEHNKILKMLNEKLEQPVIVSVGPVLPHTIKKRYGTAYLTRGGGGTAIRYEWNPNCSIEQKQKLFEKVKKYLGH